MSPAPKRTPATKRDSSREEQPRRAAIIAGNRIPFARSNGPYSTASNSDMLGAALEGLIERTGLAGEHVGEGEQGEEDDEHGDGEHGGPPGLVGARPSIGRRSGSGRGGRCAGPGRPELPLARGTGCH